jgi:hypothetical protein
VIAAAERRIDEEAVLTRKRRGASSFARHRISYCLR